MGLLHRDGRVDRSGPGRSYGGGASSAQAGAGAMGAPSAGSLRGRHSSVAMPKRAGVPSGYRDGGSWSLPQQAGELASTVFVSGTGTLTPAVAGGLNGVANLSGIGDFTSPPALQLIVNAIATLAGLGSLTGNASAALAAAASLAGSGNVTGALSALGFAVASLTGSGTASPTLNATGALAASLTPFTELSPQSLASAVWDELLANHQIAGSAGEFLSSAGGGSSPSAIAAAVLAAVVEGTITLAESMRLMNAVLAGKISGAGSGVESVRNLADTRNRVVVTVDSDGNRTLVVRDLLDP